MTNKFQTTTAKQLAFLIKEFKDFKDKLIGLKQDVNGLKQDVGGLEQDVGGLKKDVGGLKQDVNGLKQDVGGLKKDVSDLREEFNDSRVEFKNFKRMQQKQNRKVNKDLKHLRKTDNLIIGYFEKEVIVKNRKRIERIEDHLGFAHI